jgi:hypothetical protein
MSKASAGQEIGGSDRRLSNGDVFDVLQNERRRYVLQYLRHEGGPVDIGTLATHVASLEYGAEAENISKKQRKRVYTTLQQTHLPKMDDVGIVAYDEDDGHIQTTPHTEDLTVYLEVVPGSEFPWREFYLSLGAVSLAIVVILWVGVYPFNVLPALGWATLFAVTLTLSAAYHTFVGRELTLTEYVDEFEEAAE